MKTKKALLLIISIFIFEGILAQKLQKTKSADYTYTQPPLYKDLLNAKTYGVEVQLSDNERNINVRKATKMGDFRKSNDNSDLDFYIRINSLEINEKPKKEMSSDEKVKNKDGTFTTKKQYHYTQDVNFQFFIGIYNKQRVLITSKTIERREYIKGSKADDLKTAETFLARDLNKIIIESCNKQIASYIKSVENEFLQLDKKMDFYLLKIKDKTAFYNEYNEAAETIEYELVNQKSEENIRNAVQTLETIAKSIDYNNKKAVMNKTVATGVYHNLGIAYFMLKNYNASATAFEMVEKNDSKEKRTNFINAANTMSQRLSEAPKFAAIQSPVIVKEKEQPKESEPITAAPKETNTPPKKEEFEMPLIPSKKVNGVFIPYNACSKATVFDLTYGEIQKSKIIQSFELKLDNQSVKDGFEIESFIISFLDKGKTRKIKQEKTKLNTETIAMLDAINSTLSLWLYEIIIVKKGTNERYVIPPVYIKMLKD
jgi:hypothetical protein